MSNKSKTRYTSRVSVHVTPAMSDRLDQIAIMRDEPKAEIVRQALRNYLDQQEDVLGSRKHFTKMFQRRVTYIERLLSVLISVNVQSHHILQERVQKRSVSLSDVLSEAVYAGIEFEDELYTLVEMFLQQKLKPPAP